MMDMAYENYYQNCTALHIAQGEIRSIKGINWEN